MADIYTPLAIRGKTLPNRIVMGPAERVGGGFTYDDAVMGESITREYETLARSGIGLMIAQAFVVSPKSIEYTGWPMPGAYRRENLGPLARIAKAARAGGSAFVVQLGSGHPYSPRWTTADVEEFRDQHLVGARLCVDAGVDGVEIHCCHGLTLNSIVSPRTNSRSDRYADGLVLLREIVDGVRAMAPDGFIVSCRMGCGFDWERDIAMARAIEAMGVDVLNVSYGVQEAYPAGIPAGYGYSAVTFAASVLKEHVGIPVIAGIGIETVRRGDALVRAGAADLVAYAKPFLTDPLFAARSLADPDYRPCLGCYSCQWGSDGSRCPGRRRAAGAGLVH